MKKCRKCGEKMEDSIFPGRIQFKGESEMTKITAVVEFFYEEDNFQIL